MSKITIERKKGGAIITNRLVYPEAVNERVVQAITSGMFEHFLPIAVEQKRKDCIIECTVQGLIPLDVYFGGVVSKKMFLDVVSHLVQIIKMCEKNMLNANNLDLRPESIYIEPQTKAVYCIFWPIVNNQREVPPHMFLKQLPYSLTFNEQEGKEYLAIYTGFFKGIEPFSINNFERMLNRLNGKPALGETGTQFGPTETGGASEMKADGSDVSKNVAYDPVSNGNDAKKMPQPSGERDYIFCTACGTRNRMGSNYCGMCGRQLKRVAADEKPHVPPTDFAPSGGTPRRSLGNDGGNPARNEDPVTTVLKFHEPVHPYLIRAQTGEKILVDKPSFRIGAEERGSDYVVRDNKKVSRCHADILTRGERYFIVDRRSTNGTSIDDQRIPTETEMEIFSGTRLRLANEEFTFYAESFAPTDPGSTMARFDHRTDRTQ